MPQLSKQRRVAQPVHRLTVRLIADGSGSIQLLPDPFAYETVYVT